MCEQQSIQDTEDPLRTGLGAAHLLHLQDTDKQTKSLDWFMQLIVSPFDSEMSCFINLKNKYIGKVESKLD